MSYLKEYTNFFPEQGIWNSLFPEEPEAFYFKL